MSDTGIGIPPEHQERVFERFYQVGGHETEYANGAGLGLSIARSILESHGGRLVLVQSRPGQTIFELTIPAFENHPHAEPALHHSMTNN